MPSRSHMHTATTPATRRISRTPAACVAHERDHQLRERDVEGVVRPGELLRACLTHIEAGESRTQRGGERGRWLRRGHLSAAAHELCGQRTRSGADVERVHPRLEAGEVREHGREPRREAAHELVVCCVRASRSCGSIDVYEQRLVQLDDRHVETGDRASDGELTRREGGQRGLAIRARERARLRDGDVAARAGERAERVGRDVRHVDRQDDAHVGARGAQSGDEPMNRSALFDAVREHRERKLLVALPDRDALVARLPERPPGALCERLALDARERLRRAEPRARPADEQDSRYGRIRHGSV